MPGKKYKIIFLTIAIVMVAWTIDAVFYRLLHPRLSFPNLLLFEIPFEELAERTFHVTIIAICFLLAWKIFPWRRRTEEALWEGERLLDTLLNSIQEGLLIKDREYTIIRANPVAARWYAHAMPLAGKKCYEALKGRSQPCEECPSRLALETGEAASLEVPKMGPGGAPVGWLDLYAYPLFDRTTGKTTGVVEFARDITQSKQVEEALRQERDFSAAILDTISALVMVLDPQGQILRFNRASEATTGYSFEEVKGKPFWDLLLASEEVESVKEAFQEMLVPNPPYECTTYWATKGGERRLISWSSTVLLDQDGKAEFIIGTGSDITERQQAEEALRESETRYRLLVNNIPAVAFRGYADWTIDFVDDKIEDLTGYQREEFDSRRMKWCDVILAEDLQDARNIFIQALKSNKFYVREYRIRRKDGRILWIQARGQIVCDLEGKVEYISGVFFDITGRKIQEEALRQSQASLAEAQCLAHLGNWEWSPRTGEAFWSDEVYRILGLGPREIPATFKAFLQAVHPGDRGLVRKALGRALHRRKPYGIGHRIVRPDGSERFVYGQGEVYCDAHGKAERMLGTIQDVTERRRAQEALKESEKRYRLLAENVTDVIWTVDLDLRLTYVSPSIQFLTGHNAKEYLSLGLEQLLPATSLELAQNKLKELLAQEEVKTDLSRSGTIEIELFRPDGSTVWTEVKGSFLRDGQGHPVGVLGVTRDITMRRKLEEQLRQSQKMEVVGRLAGGVAHDFNNLLTAILGYCELLLSVIQADDPAHQDVAEIKKAGERAALLTRQLLAFSRRQVLRPKSLDLNQVMENLGKMLKRVIGEDIELSILPGANLGQVMADPGQIEQVILNLTVNARDAMPQGGKLIIKTADVDLDEAYAAIHAQVEPGPYVLLAVTDTGCGMDEPTRSHIFEPFFTTKEVGKGTGLGLSTVYGIIRQSGGHIWVYSESGQGTTFKIYLPRIGAGKAVPSRDRVSRASLRGHETILLVEDEDLVRQIARRILQSHGYTVLEARDGNEALQIYERHEGHIHLMLTDLVMPGLGGLELAHRLASRYPGMRVLFMSGYADNGIMDKDMQDQGLVYLQKPFEAHALTRKVREALDAPMACVPASPTHAPPLRPGA